MPYSAGQRQAGGEGIRGAASSLDPSRNSRIRKQFVRWLWQIFVICYLLVAPPHHRLLAGKYRVGTWTKKARDFVHTVSAESMQTICKQPTRVCVCVRDKSIQHAKTNFPSGK